MEIVDAGLFLLFVAIGAYVQTLTGFAMGLLIMGAVTFLDLAPVAFSAAVVSLLSLLNTILALRYSLKFVDWRIVRQICIGLFPAMLLGVFLLDLLSDAAYVWLRRTLGLVIIMAGTLLILRPQPWRNRSGVLVVSLFGAAGGVIGGMFSTGGAPLAFMMYRQPFELGVIRASLLAVFFLTTSSRTFLVALNGHLTTEVLSLAAIAVPLVLLPTVFARRLTPEHADVVIRRIVFIVLILIGTSLLFA